MKPKHVRKKAKHAIRKAALYKLGYQHYMNAVMPPDDILKAISKRERKAYRKGWKRARRA
jgi:hypothetical protein